MQTLSTAYDPHERIAQFEAFLVHERRYSVHTVRAYMQDLMHLKNFLTAQADGENLCITQVVRADLRAWIAEMSSAGASTSTISRRISSVKSFLNFFIRQGLVKTNVATLVPVPKKTPHLAGFLSSKESGALFDYLQQEGGKHERKNTRPILLSRETETLIIEVFYCTGMRLAEVVAMQDGDVDTQARTIRVHGKGSKVRLVPISPALADMLEKYRENRPAYNFENDSFFSDQFLPDNSINSTKNNFKNNNLINDNPTKNNFKNDNLTNDNPTKNNFKNDNLTNDNPTKNNFKNNNLINDNPTKNNFKNNNLTNDNSIKNNFKNNNLINQKVTNENLVNDNHQKNNLQNEALRNQTLLNNNSNTNNLLNKYSKKNKFENEILLNDNSQNEVLLDKKITNTSEELLNNHSKNNIEKNNLPNKEVTNKNEKLVPTNYQKNNLQHKKTINKTQNTPFWIKDDGSALNAKYVYRLVKKHLSAVRTHPERSPHTLRHTFASQLLQRGAPISAIKELLGHASLAATQIYTHNDISSLIVAHKNAHPKS